jgi:CelD/BcsL family acetyltransferase involved in cellulose biosynthesis
VLSDTKGVAGVIPVRRAVEQNTPLKIVSLRTLSRFEMLYADACISPEVDASAIGRALFSHSLPGERRPDVLRFHYLPEESSLLSIVRGLARRENTDAVPGTSIIAAGADSQSWLSGLSRNLRGQIKQSAKRLQQIGNFEVRIHTSTNAIEEAFDRFVQLEAAGYKGASNALAREDGDREVFRSALRYHSLQGESFFMELWLGDHLAATQFGILRRQRLHLLKIAFNESFTSASPGVFIISALLQHCSDSGIATEVDCCVRQTWHDRWHPTTEVRYAVNLPNTGTPIGMLLAGARWARHRRLLFR